jgi:hypothetical protein
VGSDDDELLAELKSVAPREAAEILSMLPMEQAVRLVQRLAPPAIAELLLALPTPERIALQEALGPLPGAVTGSDYHRAAEASLGRVATSVTWLAPRVGILMVDVFGRAVQVALRDRPGQALGPPDVHAAVVGVDWRRARGLVVLTNARLDPGLGAALREFHQRGYRVEVVSWHDDRDDGALKRALVRLAG